MRHSIGGVPLGVTVLANETTCGNVQTGMKLALNIEH
jgi:hypothetical protein